MKMNIFVLLIAMLAVSCVPVHVETDTIAGTDFSAIKVFSWLETTTAPGNDVRVNNPALAALVRAAVEKELKKKGFTRGEDGDFLVNWLGAIKGKVREESIQHFYSGYGYQTMSGAIAGDTATAGTVGTYEDGTIVIDILDPQKHELLWRGAGTRRLLKDMDEAQVAGYVNLSVAEILKNFPPGTNK
ncbi:MAG: DUF4136 domain-containing protein [Deltaproteobacteria bacterium]|nr:DUF4136 domain-containing protein [Deltaproteobacteria bacterium]